MPQKDTGPIKEKIVSTIKSRGPSLPVHIAKTINMSMLFSSAFLSELIAEKKLKVSNLKVGGSPLYLIPGQELKLQNFAEHVKGKEREAYDLLKEKQILQDTAQQPAIRVALRSIKDFAFAFKIQNSDELYWRFITISEQNAISKLKPKTKQKGVGERLREEQTKSIITERGRELGGKPPSKEKEKPIIPPSMVKQISTQLEQPKPRVTQTNEDSTLTKPVAKGGGERLREGQTKSTITERGRKLGGISEARAKEPKNKDLQIFDKPKEPKPKKTTKKKSSAKVNEKFFNQIKEYLTKKQIIITDIVSFSKSDILLKIKSNEQESLLVAHNKKRVTGEEIIKAHKKAQELGLQFIILCKGDQTKKLTDFLDAAKNLQGIEKLE